MSYVALITGASSGIGEATARRLAREGDVQLVLVARREEKLRTLAAELGGATVVAVDLTAPEAPARIRETLEREHAGRLHLLVNNAGTAWRRGWLDHALRGRDTHTPIQIARDRARYAAALAVRGRAAARAPPAPPPRPRR